MLSLIITPHVEVRGNLTALTKIRHKADILISFIDVDSPKETEAQTFLPLSRIRRLHNC
jgi:hypothetical protein